MPPHTLPRSAPALFSHVMADNARPWPVRTGCRQPPSKPVVARWDDRLTSAMSERRVVMHEEGVAETLMMDLAASMDSER
jgi:hypothetical protein